MTLRTWRELQVTKKKLKSLEEQFALTSQEEGEDPYVQELTLESLKRMINQLTEEIARYEAHARVAE